MNKQYLGDSVYIEWDGFGYTLTTENGLPDDPSNTIYLEPEVLDVLLHYLRLKPGRSVVTGKTRYDPQVAEADQEAKP